ncbi:sugar transferase [Tateyamaria sp.]|uniref:sugar transferase n=1 Tax=Tateyamaria sp. TaxID=1929288 RepID=UPI00329C4F46
MKQEYAGFLSSQMAGFRPDSASVDQDLFDEQFGQCSLVFRFAKRSFDIVMVLLLLVPLMMAMIVLAIANPFWNKGSMFFVQTRMGQNCKPFNAMKLRTMSASASIERTANCPLEEDRITPLGKWLRKTRLDELPQILNVMAGDMSMIGPRPDYFEHALHFLKEVPGYRARHAVRPGISGLAQTEIGYAVGNRATRKKVNADLIYIQNRTLRLEAWIVWRTLSVVIGRCGI